MNVLFFVPEAFNLSETFLFEQYKYKQPDLNKILVTTQIKNEEVYQIDMQKCYLVDAYPKTLLNRILSKFDRLLNPNYSHFPFFTKILISKIIRKHKIDLIHCQYGNYSLQFLPIIKKFPQIKLVCHFHGYDASKLLNYIEYTQRLKLLFERSYKTIVVSKDMLERLSAFGLIISKCLIIPYGIEINLFKPTHRQNPKIKILHSGRLTYKKGVPDLLKALALLDKAILMNIEIQIVGDGEERASCEEIIKIHNLQSNVDMFRAQPHSVVRDFMQNADIFVLNSRTAENGDMEGFPVSLIEAMSCGCAVISTYHSGIPEVIDNGINGILVEEKNNQELSIAIKELILNSELRHQLSKNARLKAVSQFSNDKMNLDIYNLYSEIVNDNS